MIDARRLPPELRACRRWVLWNRETRDGNPTKVPYVPQRPQQRAAVDAPSTWGSFADALAAVEDGKADGAGFCLGDGWAGVDLDQCRDPETGTIDRAALAIVRALDSYTEISPSGRGLHILVRGTLPPGRRRIGTTEMYSDGRYFTVTGHHLEGTRTTVEERTAELRALHARVFSAGDQPTRRRAGSPLVRAVDHADATLLENARVASNGAAFAALWAGDTSLHGGDDSAADLALCNYFAFWTHRDPSRIDRLFRQSGLMRAKWDERRGTQTYGAMTIARAVAQCRETDSAPTPSPEPAPDAPPARPVIVTTHLDLAHGTAQALAALVAANDPARLFVLGDRPVRIEPHPEDGRPITRELTEARVVYHLAETVQWVTRGKDGHARPALPSVPVARNILATPALPFPPLERIVEIPIFGRDGALCATPGYHPNARLFYQPARGLEIPPIPTAPTDAQLEAARDLLCVDLIAEFPFVGPAERAHAVALLMLPFVRDLIDDPTPLHLIEKPSAGTGAASSPTCCCVPRWAARCPP